MGNSEQTLMDRVPETVLDSGPAWLVEMRTGAARRLRETGFPHRKVEAWRFTSVAPVTGVAFERARQVDEIDPDVAALVADETGTDDSWRVVMVNGRPHLDAAGPAPSGVEVATLAAVLASDGESVRGQLGSVAKAEHFAALNSALFEDGIVIRARRGYLVGQPIQIVHVSSSGDSPTAAYPRVLVVAEEGSHLRLVETYLARGTRKQLTNAVTEVIVGPSANVDHVRVQKGSASCYHVASLAVRQEAGSVYASRAVALGGALCRLDVDVLLGGEGADCILDGVYHVDSGDHVDHHTFIDHAVPRCTSNENYRGIVDGTGHAVFDGTTVVRRDAQQSNAHQENRNLLLSDDATINTKPHLEIDADDIVASHGATIGALDDKQLFYLRSRGIDEELARAALTFGFVQALIERIPHPDVAGRLGAALRARLPHGDRVAELLS